MSKTKLLLVVAFFLVFAAGAVVGFAPEWRPHAQQPDRRGLDEMLGLSPEQRQQMKEIWSHVQEKHRELGPKWPELRQQRDEQIRNLLTPQQRPEYDRILQEFAQRAHELDAQMDEAVRQAEERTRQILTPEQQAKFDQIRKEHGPHFRGMLHRGHGGAGPPATSPSHAAE